jgi:hypothetical protein
VQLVQKLKRHIGRWQLNTILEGYVERPRAIRAMNTMKVNQLVVANNIKIRFDLKNSFMLYIFKLKINLQKINIIKELKKTIRLFIKKNNLLFILS